MHPTDQCDSALLECLSRALPPAALLIGDAIEPRYQEDRRNRFSAPPRFVLRPGNTAEVSIALAACHDFGQRLVVQGGRTGLAGAHRVQLGEAVLSLERLTDLAPPDPDSRTIMAGAGVPLQRVQEAADQAGLMFGVDIGARGTATIGGNIATNAGGIRVMRYGMFRAQVAGLEAVLADGSILSSLRGLDKDNSGYDLKQLLIGSEGTLAVVTRALLRLHPRPVFETNALLALPSAEAVLDLLQRLRRRVGGMLSAYEIMQDEIYRGVCGHLGIVPPVAAVAPVYVLAEIQSETDGEDIAGSFMDCLAEAIEDKVALDAVLAQSQREFLSLWEMRDACADYLRGQDNIANGDVSVPVPRLAEFLRESQRQLSVIDPKTRFLVFGHVADGNLHYVFQTVHKDQAVTCLMNLVAVYGGSISAEHGIGLDKKTWLPLARTPTELAVMRALKGVLDPKGILNRDRIFAF
ncbi:FAD-binding oxidoreductase [Paracoccus sp. SY]|uniref:FAD-binding oxidoreductase n=1 Tax=Paracoccus sp. SY TaxID=1330255 RepID=UPI000CD238F7|nr:FAD-binding oxidoreductase [Paracoccus sp. SY]